MIVRKKPEALLEDWRWLRDGPRLLGQFFGHSVIPDGRYARTSRIIATDMEAGVVETVNSIYTLGAPAKEIKNKWRY